MSDQRTVLLLDGHSLAYRAFHALPDTLRTATGQLTNAVYGFTSMLVKLLADRDPDVVVVAFDRGRDVERTSAFPAYKANRAETPEEFRPQVELIKQVLAALDVPVVEVEGVEADDVLATLATRAVAAGAHAYVVTGDRDAMQLVDEHLTVLYTLRGITELAEMTPSAVEQRYGVPPASYVELASLRGDTSDNLPGVPGVGDKTAAKLLTTFGDLDTVYERLEEVPGRKVPAMLAEHREQVELNRRVMRLRRNVDVALDPATVQRPRPDGARVRELFGSLEFRALYDRLPASLLGEAEAADTPLEVTPRPLEAGTLARWLAAAEGPVAILALCEGRVPHLRWDGLALAVDGTDPVSADLDRLRPDDLDALRTWLAAPERPKVTHEVKQLEHAARARGWALNGVALDTELAAYLLAPEQRSFELDRLALQELGRSLDPDRVAGDGGQLSLEVAADHEPLVTRGLAVAAVLQLADHLGAELDRREQRGLHDRIELPLAPVLAGMERTGVAVDREVLSGIRTGLAGRVRSLEQEVHDQAGRTFNVGSGPQLQQVLFEELGLPRTRKIKTGYSTDAQALAGLLDAHPIVPLILEWRELSKLLTTYVDALPPLIDPVTGRIHTTFSQTIAATGRLSSSHPNLQNIPVRRAEGREIRRAFVAGDGFEQLLVADYSQIELRILAHLSGDQGLLDAFASGEDIHATTAAKVFDVPLAQVDGGLRDRAKAVNYGLAYGLTPFGLAQQLGINPQEAAGIVDAYFARFPEVRSFLDAAVQQATRDGYTTTLFGRRRYLPDLRSDDRNRRQMAERMALNAPIQGTAADVIKLAMIDLARELASSGLRAQLLLQVHDEVILEAPEEELEATRAMVEQVLSGVADLQVPLEVDTATGPTWFDAQKH